MKNRMVTHPAGATGPRKALMTSALVSVTGTALQVLSKWRA